MTALAVLGSPIAHSKSPLLHRAAYAVLGLDWDYTAIEAVGTDVPGLLAQGFRGLSLTMPLKREVLPLLDWIDPVAELTGGANTVLVDGLRGYNTDVHGIVRAFANAGITTLDDVQVIGAGATAASAIAAAAQLGATAVTVSARTPGRAAPLVELGARIGVAVTVEELGAVAAVASVVINTLPGGTAHGIRGGDGVLFEVAYDPWPSPLVSAWRGTVIDGLDMLIEQALVQVRIFVSGDPNTELDDEPRVLAAMRAAVSR